MNKLKVMVFNNALAKYTYVELPCKPSKGDNLSVHHVKEEVTDVVFVTPKVLDTMKQSLEGMDLLVYTR